MKTIQTKSGEILLVKVPEDAKKWKISATNYVCWLIDKWWQLDPTRLDEDFDWKIIGKFSELKDEVFEEFIDFALHRGHSCNVYRNYLKLARNYILSSAKDSFKCLCESQGIEDDLSNYLIIKKL